MLYFIHFFYSFSCHLNSELNAALLSIDECLNASISIIVSDVQRLNIVSLCRQTHLQQSEWASAELHRLY